MMIIDEEKLEEKPHGWRKMDHNRWADFIELLCLKQEIVSVEDIIDIWSEDDLDNDLGRGEEKHSDFLDKTENDVKDYFRILTQRSAECGEYYPFILEEDSLVKKDSFSSKQYQYLFLLMCSSISFMSRPFLQKYTHRFEEYSKEIMRRIVPKGAKVELFGTSREATLFSGNLKNRIKQLADCLNLRMTKGFADSTRYDNIPAGDGGLDIVAYFALDQAEAIPFSFAQCACSYKEWIDKQYSVMMDKWRSRLEGMKPYSAYIFIPFSCHNAKGKLESPTDIVIWPIDRIRIIKIIQMEEEVLDSVRGIVEECMVENGFLLESEI